jgi:hypothetical protein
MQRRDSMMTALIGVLILAMVAVTLIPILESPARSDANKEFMQAVLVAEAQLAVPGRSEPLRPGQAQGIEAERFRWTRTVSPVEGDARAYGIHVAVEWAAEPGTRRIELDTMRLDTGRGTLGARR